MGIEIDVSDELTLHAENSENGWRSFFVDKSDKLVFNCDIERAMGGYELSRTIYEGAFPLGFRKTLQEANDLVGNEATRFFFLYCYGIYGAEIHKPRMN